MSASIQNTKCGNTNDIRQRTWIRHLPYDILAQVFGHLQQSELLECMAVCQAWYHYMPHFTDRWRSVKIYRRGRGLSNHRLARCLGQHVRRVSLSGYETEQQLNQVLRGLVDLGCMWIEALEFYDTGVSVHQSFFGWLAKLASNALREITFLRHRGVLDFFHVVAVCPHLTLFDFSASSGGQGDLEAYSMPTRTKITSLFLNGRPYDVHPKLELILRQCPLLRFFATDNPWIRSQKNMDKLLQYCPSIEYFEYARHTRHARHYCRQQQPRPCVDPEEGQKRCLRELVLDGYRSGNMPDPSMLATLEVLRLRTTLIRSLVPFSGPFDRLSVLSCDQVLCDPPALLASFIQQCPTLEQVVLRGFPLVPEVCEALSGLSRLKRLHLHRNNVMRTEEEVALQPLLQTLQQRPLLESLRLEGLLTDPLTDALSMHAAQPHLVELRIGGKYLTNSGLDQFITKAVYGILSALKTLEICDITGAVSKRTLNAIGELDHLEHLELRRCCTVDGEGICDILDIARNLRSLCIAHCNIKHAGGKSAKDTVRYATKKLGEHSMVFVPWRFISPTVRER